MIEFETIDSLLKYISAPQPLDLDFVITRIENTRACNMDMPPFRNRLYAICFYTEVSVCREFYTDFQKTTCSEPALYFKIPYQILSWKDRPGVYKGYYLFFSEAFVLKYMALVDFIYNLTFLRHDQILPLVVNSREAGILKLTFENIFEEYHSGNSNRMDIIANYIQILLLQTQRVYQKCAEIAPNLLNADNKNDLGLSNRFKTLLEQCFKNLPSNHCRSVGHYAEQLGVPASYLSAAVKRVNGKTAQELIQEYIIRLSKIMLVQSQSSIKEIAYQLSFSDPAHFAKFFKKNAFTTPANFRKKIQHFTSTVILS
jgi:AraC family transcriptional activator of pobA